MASRNLYLTYKKDTSRLLYWIIHTSNGIIMDRKAKDEDLAVSINTTGQCTVVEIVTMSRLIAKHFDPVPLTILRLLQGIIRVRSKIYDVFQQIVSEVPDPDIERSNATHKHFIDTLTEALEALSGPPQNSRDFSSDDEEFDNETLFRNRFSALSLGEEDGDAASADDIPQTMAEIQNKTNRKGNTGKRAKKSKRKPSSRSAANVPMKNYHIIEDKDGIDPEYHLAVCALALEWMDLRSFTQDLWSEVAYKGLNGAVAASLTGIAVAMVKQTCIAVFAEFPDHESYCTIMRAIMRGDPETSQARFALKVWGVPADGGPPVKVIDRKLGVKERLWVHAYHDLLTFISDFRKNRTGKPTKAMQAQLNNWNPTFDLQSATDEERISWRRAYTINWLYDLVNVFSSVVVRRNKVKGEHHVYEDVDWSKTGPW
jgi:hypothetical protein